MNKLKCIAPIILVAFTLVFISQSSPAKAQAGTDQPLVKIVPTAISRLNVSDTFTVNVTVGNVPPPNSTYYGIYAVELRLSYDPSVLNCTNVNEGQFFSSVRSTLLLENYSEVNLLVEPPTAKVYFTCSLSGVGPTDAYNTTGDRGVLVSMIFNVTSEGSTELRLDPYDPVSTHGMYFMTRDTLAPYILPAIENGFYSSPVEFSVTPSTINVGDNATLSGQILGSAALNVTSVTLQYRQQGAVDWNNVTTVSTNGSGFFSYNWTSTDAGVFEFQTAITFEGITTYSSPPQTLTVKAIPFPWTYVIIAIIVVIIVVVAVLVYLRRRGGKKAEEMPPPP
jgi:desulfoferrodoxin (superoxide reductase-like protein)